ncbi:MAG: 2-amino-4-hydroxy-6-hydroxymethyldihydropteridine diphosphokinase [Dehalococcoidia bacterium]
MTDLGARALLRLCKAIEADAGRDFGAPRNSARPIDVDILLIEGEQVTEPDLEVPHAAMHTRGFVLVPLAEIAAEVVHPVLRRSVRQLLEELPGEERAGIRRAAGPEWARLGGRASS